MRIQHNISALNSYRQLGGNNNGLSKNLEKLSSGYRINRAGDDAAGLAISEKMRAQIRGLETAQKNSQDGISLVQTAEGALTEVHSMLNRMVELATQSSNGTFDDKTDRANLQKEIASLKEEIDRISDATNFNGINLLDGSMGAGATTKDETITVTGGTVTAQKHKAQDTVAAPTTAAGTAGTYEIEYKLNGKSEKVTIDYIGTGTAQGNAGAIVEEMNKMDIFKDFKIDVDATGIIKMEAKNTGNGGPRITKMGGHDVTAANYQAGTNDNAVKLGTLATGNTITIGDRTLTYKTGGTADASKDEYGSLAEIWAELDKMGYEVVNNKGEIDPTMAANSFIQKKASANGGDGLKLQIGDTADDFNQLNVSVGDMSIDGLGLKDVDISTQDKARDAVKAIKDAINTVSSARGDLGAVQNRLEHTIENLGVTTENMNAAEARIRDTDMAKEMMAYTKNNILVQASQAMLAQANQVPQGVLQLLQ